MNRCKDCENFWNCCNEFNLKGIANIKYTGSYPNPCSKFKPNSHNENLERICRSCEASYACDYRSVPDCPRIVNSSEIREIAGIVDTALKSDYEFTDVKALEVADEIINKLGYHKQIWHKVENGDLPKKNWTIFVLCSYM